MEIDREKLSAFTQAIFAAYQNRRKIFHPSWRTTPRWDKFWLIIADAIIRAGIEDPAGYVEAQFDLVKPFPQPNQLHGPRAMRNYVDWQARRDREGLKSKWEMAARSELRYMRTRVNMAGPKAHAKEVLHPAAPLSPVFRACWAIKCGCVDLVPPEQWSAWVEAARLVFRVGAAVEAYTELGILTPDAAQVLDRD